MALVAYSDESDISDSGDEGEERTNSSNVDSVGSGTSKSSALLNHAPVESSAAAGVDSIIEEEEEEDTDYITLNSDKGQNILLLSSIPKAEPVNVDWVEDEANIATDKLDDVPTLDTWKMSLSDGAFEKKGDDKCGNSSSTKTKGKTVKFFLPSLSEFNDVEEDMKENHNKEEGAKKTFRKSSGSGLFSVLPKPKIDTFTEPAKALVPNSVKRKGTCKPLQNATPGPSKPALIDTSEPIDSDEDDDVEDVESADFFSLSKMDTSPVTERPVSPAADVIPSVAPAIEVDMPDSIVMSEQSLETVEYGPVHVSDADTGPKLRTLDEIDKEAMMKLAGKRKRGKEEEINFIDVDARDALLPKDEYMLKSLTEEKPASNAKGMPSGRSKRKHQITFLAYQAKAREIELKNTWAENRLKKMQSRFKYGF